MSQIFWSQREDARRFAPCLFLDRDGVVVEEVGYLHRLEDVKVLPGAAAAITAARARGFAVGLVTNQAGIGRGYYDWTDFIAVQKTIADQLALGDEPFDFVAACGAHPEARHDSMRIADHAWRKPNFGMLRMAETSLSLGIADSIMVGDQLTDLQAGLAAGVAKVVHVRTGHGAQARSSVEAFARACANPAIVLTESLADAPRALGWT